MNQRSEWGKSRKPFLMNGAGIQSHPEEERRCGAGNKKRGMYREGREEEEVTEDQEGLEEGKERPIKRRNRRKGPEAQETAEGSQEMGEQASTPVAIKVRRVDDKIRE